MNPNDTCEDIPDATLADRERASAAVVDRERASAAVVDRERASAAAAPPDDGADALAVLTGVLAATSEGFVATDPQGRVRWCNPPCRALFLRYYGSEPRVGEPILDVLRLHPEAQARLRGLLERALAGDTIDLVFSPRTSGGDDAVGMQCRPLRGGAGQVVGVLLALRDLSSVRRAEIAFRQAEERLLRAPMALIEFDRELRLRRWSKKAENLFGWPAAQVLGRRPEEFGFVHPEDQPRVTALLQSLTTGGEDYLVSRSRHIGCDGQVLEIEWYDSALRGEGGSDGVLALALDITARVRAERERGEVQERLSRVAAAIGLGFWYCDLPFDELRWDGQVRGHFFFPPEGRVTMADFYARVHPEDREGTRQAIEHAIETGGRYDREFRTYDPSPDAAEAGPRQCRWIRALGWTDRDPAGRPRRFDGITLDVTPRVEASQRVARHYQQAQAAIQARDEFLSVASHELKTPLTPLKLQVQSLLRAAQRDGALQLDRVVQTAMRCDAQVRRLAKLVDELLDVSRISAGKLQLALEEVDLVNLVGEQVGQHSAEMKAAGCVVTLRTDGRGPAPLIVRADPLRLEQVLGNLLNNAAKYAPGAAVRVAVERDEDAVFVTVEDEGPGIRAADQERIFARFERGVTDQHVSGLGLGLYLCRQIMRAHGGDISVDSAPGHGSRFTLRLPVGLPPAAR